MKERLKIFIAWIMLALMLYNAGFCFLIIELSMQFNRSVIEKILSEKDEGELQILKITDLSSVIRQGNHEIVFEGKRYDVKKEIRKDGIVYFYCIHDEREDYLAGALNTSVHNNSDAQNEKQFGHFFDVLKHLVKDYFHENTFVQNTETINSCKSFVVNETFHSHNYFSVITPPPKG